MRTDWGPRGAATIVIVAGAFVARDAAAHIELLDPPARYGPEDLKNAPCGPDPALGLPPSGSVTTYAAGESITVSVDEFVGHVGTIVVVLDPTGTDDFHIPTSFDDIAYANVLTSVEDPPGGDSWSIDVTLPDAPCDPCTLQVIQIMEDDGVFGPGTSDLYFQCADIVIEQGAVGDSGGPPTTTGPAGDSSGGGGGDGTTAGGAGGADASGDGAGGTVGGADGAATSGAATTTAGGDGGGAGGDDSGCAIGDRGGSSWALWLLALPWWRRRRP